MNEAPSIAPDTFLASVGRRLEGSRERLVYATTSVRRLANGLYGGVPEATSLAEKRAEPDCMTAALDRSLDDLFAAVCQLEEQVARLDTLA